MGLKILPQILLDYVLKILIYKGLNFVLIFLSKLFGLTVSNLYFFLVLINTFELIYMSQLQFRNGKPKGGGGGGDDCWSAGIIV